MTPDHGSERPTPTARALPRLRSFDGLTDYRRKLAKLGYSATEIAEHTSAAIAKLPAPRRRPLAHAARLRLIDIPRCAWCTTRSVAAAYALTENDARTEYLCAGHLPERLDAVDRRRRLARRRYEAAAVVVIEQLAYKLNRRAQAHGRTEYILARTPVTAAIPLRLF